MSEFTFLDFYAGTDKLKGKPIERLPGRLVGTFPRPIEVPRKVSPRTAMQAFGTDRRPVLVMPAKRPVQPTDREHFPSCTFAWDELWAEVYESRDELDLGDWQSAPLYAIWNYAHEVVRAQFPSFRLPSYRPEGYPMRQTYSYYIWEPPLVLDVPVKPPIKRSESCLLYTTEEGDCPWLFVRKVKV